MRLWNKAKAITLMLVALVLSMFVGTGEALATAPTFDTAPITDAITAYGADAVVVVGALIVVIWGLKALGILGGKR